MIETVLFDLDGTLVEYERPGEEVLAAAFEAAGVEPFFGADEYADHFESHLPADSAADLRRRCFEAVARRKGRDPAVARRVADAYTEEREPPDVTLIEGAERVLDALAGEYRLGLVTNGPRDHQAAKLEVIGLADAFETVVFAGAETAPKPDPDPFERALDRLGAPAESAVHVGNSLSSDVAGARRAGLRSVWLPATHDDPDPEPHHAVPSLSHLHEEGPPWA